jgi:uncharacterized Fe-S cluster protein YjdI
MGIRDKIKSRNIVREYTNGEVTIVWQPNKCCSSGICVKMSPKVFCPAQKPWIQPQNSTTEDIIKTVKKCPSEALTYYMNKDKTE